MNFVEGALWSEAGAGTNAVGTALAAEHAVQVFAAEHFTEPVQRWTCAAAPVRDPDTGALLGVIDLTGDFTSVHPHSLSVVVATARGGRGAPARAAARARRPPARPLRGRRGPAAAGAALVTGSRPRHARPDERWALRRTAAIPAGGGRSCSRRAREAIAEPVEDDDLYVVRPRAPRLAPAPARSSSCACSATQRRGRRRRPPPAPAPAPRRAARAAPAAPRAVDADVLCAELYGDAGHPASVRVEMSRLRKLLPGAIEPDGYGLPATSTADVRRVRALLGRGAVADAAAAYPGSLLPGSTAPGIERARDELEGWLRQAVITSDDAEALWSWVQSPSGATTSWPGSGCWRTLDYDERAAASRRRGPQRYAAVPCSGL